MKTCNRRQFLATGGRLALLGALPLTVALQSGCKTMESLADLSIGVGGIDRERTASVTRVARAVARSFEDITPEQEYYLGRSVGAEILARYPVYDRPAANDYLNLLGQALVQISDRPLTFGGYHFLLLDSDEINAFAAPGGFIFITRGMVRCCPHEDALAAVLAHEIGHVEKRHGLQAIERARLTSALGIIAAEGAKAFGGADLARLVRDFEGAIGDITSTLINNGYSRAFERQADQAAAAILTRRGYQPRALVEMLAEMEQRLTPGGLDFARTHPAPRSRIEELEKQLEPTLASSQPPARQARFQSFLHEA